jgi:DNA repair protein RadC
MRPLKISEMAPDERPREKMAARGEAALTDPELLALLIRTGVKGANAVDVGRELLERYGSLTGLSRCTEAEIAKIRGVGKVKAGLLVAAFGIGKRLAAARAQSQKLDCPEAIVALLGPEMRRLRKESLQVVLLDTRYQLKGIEQVSLGTINESIAHPRDVLRPAVLSYAYAIVVVHNHPSGDASPSQTDHSLTRRLAEAAELMQIKLLDHIIIGAVTESAPGYFSFKEAGVL